MNPARIAELRQMAAVHPKSQWLDECLDEIERLREALTETELAEFWVGNGLEYVELFRLPHSWGLPDADAVMQEFRDWLSDHKDSIPSDALCGYFRLSCCREEAASWIEIDLVRWETEGDARRAAEALEKGP